MNRSSTDTPTQSGINLPCQNKGTRSSILFCRHISGHKTNSDTARNKNRHTTSRSYVQRLLGKVPASLWAAAYHLGLNRVSQEECARLRESVPYVKVYRYNPKHLYQKLNGYGDNGQRSLKL